MFRKTNTSTVNRMRRAVDQLDINNGKVVVVNRFESMCEASRITGIDLGNISRASTAEGRKAGGYRWRKV